LQSEVLYFGESLYGIGGEAEHGLAVPSGLWGRKDKDRNKWENK